MTRDEIEAILSSILDKEKSLFDSPSQSDWDNLSKKFNCNFNKEFKSFIELMSKYSFPGDIYNVSSGRTNGNDRIDFVYDWEIQSGSWNSDMIPFYGIGNGDYFCINANENSLLPVYYFYHDDFRIEKYADSFDEWIKGLPTFLA